MSYDDNPLYVTLAEAKEWAWHMFFTGAFAGMCLGFAITTLFIYSPISAAN